MTKATVLVGPQGSGKTSRAMRIAGRNATFWDEPTLLEHYRRGFSRTPGIPAGLVIDGVHTPEALTAIKALVVEMKIEPIVVCTSNMALFPTHETPRRFSVVRMQRAAAISSGSEAGP